MPAIGRLICTVDLDPAARQALRDAAGGARCDFLDARDRGALHAALADAEVAYLAHDLDLRGVVAPALRWIHLDHAGLERSARPELFARGIRLSGAAGRSAPALAEHALHFMLALTYDVRRALLDQLLHRWRPRHPDRRRALHGQTLGLVGLGHTGRALAPLAKALGMRVIAYRRRVAPAPPGVDQVFAADEGAPLHLLLRESDFVVLAATLSDATHHMIDEAALAATKPGAFLINVARGGLVDERALVRALRSRHLGGAALDTFAVEPLPKTSPLWRLPNVLITPHQTPPVPDKRARALAIACDNLARYREGRPLINELTAADAYSR